MAFCSAKSPNGPRNRCLTCGTITIGDWRGSEDFYKPILTQKNRAGNLTGRPTMLNEEGPHLEYFDELCALAAGGQISESELVELQDHVERCAHCRSAYADFVDLLHHKLPLADPDVTGSIMPAG